MSFEEKLIGLVRENDFLYNTKSRSYKNVAKRNFRWQTIADILNKPVEDCKQRFKSLRDRYVREKKLRDQPSGSASSFREEWEFFDLMQFLNPSLQTRRQTGNYTGADDGVYETAHEENSPSQIPNEELKPTRASKRKRDVDFAAFLDQLKVPEAPYNINEEFMVNMAKRMEVLHPRTVTQLHKAMLDLVEAEVEKELYAD